MVNRWGWLAAAVLAAALTGCKSGDTQGGGGPPPENQPTTGGEAQPAGGDAGTQPATGGDAGTQPNMSGTPGGEMSSGGSTQPAGTGAPAAAAQPVQLMASWMGEGAGRKAMVKAGSDEVATLDPANPAVNDAVVTFLKGKRESMVAGGQQPKVTIMVPTDMPFDQVGQPLMKAAFRAGFRASEVEYKPGK